MANGIMTDDLQLKQCGSAALLTYCFWRHSELAGDRHTLHRKKITGKEVINDHCIKRRTDKLKNGSRR